MHIASIIAHIDATMGTLPEHIPPGPEGWQWCKLRDSLLAAKGWAVNIQRKEEGK